MRLPHGVLNACCSSCAGSPRIALRFVVVAPGASAFPGSGMTGILLVFPQKEVKNAASIAGGTAKIYLCFNQPAGSARRARSQPGRTDWLLSAQ